MDEFWTPSFLRMISTSEDDRKLRIFRKLILHRWGELYIQDDNDVKVNENLVDFTFSSSGTEESKIVDYYKCIEEEKFVDDRTDEYVNPQINDEEIASHKSVRVTNLDDYICVNNTISTCENTDPVKISNSEENTADNIQETTIKIKITLPKGILSKDAQKNAKNLIQSNVLNIINDISKSGIQKIECPLSQNLLEKEVNNSSDYTKYTDCSDYLCDTDAQNDAEIIKKLVLGRYSNFLNRYQQRSKVIVRNTSPDCWEDTSYPEIENVSSTPVEKSSSSSSVSSSSCTTSTRTNSTVVNENNTTYIKTGSEKTAPEDDTRIILEDSSRHDESTFASQDLSLASSFTSSNPTYSEDHSVDTSEISALISNKSSLYNIVQKQPSHGSRIVPVREAQAQPATQPEHKLTSLLRESVIQKQIMLQTSKALRFCKNIKEFAASAEQIEAERILLLATYKRERVLDEIRRADYEELNDTQPQHSGFVTISKLKFPLHQNYNKSTKSPRLKEYSQWFVCILSSGAAVLCTKAVQASNDAVEFRENFTFEQLAVDFELNISIYSLTIRRKRLYSHESKFHLDKNYMCPTPKEILRFKKEYGRYKSRDSSEFHQPSFELAGAVVLGIADIITNRPYKISKVPPNSILHGTFSMNTTSGVEVLFKCSGFLTVCSEICNAKSWNRRWCCLEGTKLKYWNYPCDESISEPIEILDLTNCVNQICAADRSLCAKSKTFLLETVVVPSTNRSQFRSSRTVARHLFAADTSTEMKEWENRLNSVVLLLKKWNCMKCQLNFK